MPPLVPYINITNEVSYLKYTNLRTNVTSMIRKAGVTIQEANAVADKDDSLFIQATSGYVVYIKWADVRVPKRRNVSSLAYQLMIWCSAETNLSNLYSDRPISILQVKTSYDTSPLYVDEVRNTSAPFPALTGAVVDPLGFAGGAPLESRVDCAAREVMMFAPADSNGLGNGGRIVRQTKGLAACPSDKYVVSIVTGSFLDPAGLGGAPYSAALSNSPSNLSLLDYSIGTVASMGVFDDNRDVVYGVSNVGNGIFFQYSYQPDRTDYTTDVGAQADLATFAADADGYSNYIDDWKAARMWAVLRTNYSGSQVDIRVPQAAWSLDRLDVDREGSLYDLDPTQHQTAVIKWGVVPGADCQLGFVNRSIVNWVHAFDTRQPEYHLGTAALPIRWELDNRAGACNAAVRQGRAISSCDGEHTVPGRPLSFDTHITQTTLTTQKQVPIISFRMQADRNRGRVHPQRLNLLNTMAAGSCKYELRRNATLVGADWAAGSNYTFDEDAAGTSMSLRDQGSFVEVDTAATEVTGGHTVLSGYLYNSESRDVAMDFSELQLTSRIDGTSDTLTLVCFFIAGVCEIAASMTLVEYD